MDAQTLAAAMALSKGSGGGGGSGGGYLKVGMDMGTMTLDKTWKEIYDALSAGYYVNITTQWTGQAIHNPVFSCLNDRSYEVRAYNVLDDGISVGSFITDSENGYPVMQS